MDVAKGVTQRRDALWWSQRQMPQKPHVKKEGRRERNPWDTQTGAYSMERTKGATAGALRTDS